MLVILNPTIDWGSSHNNYLLTYSKMKHFSTWMKKMKGSRILYSYLKLNFSMLPCLQPCKFNFYWGHKWKKLLNQKFFCPFENFMQIFKEILKVAVIPIPRRMTIQGQQERRQFSSTQIVASVEANFDSMTLFRHI